MTDNNRYLDGENLSDLLKRAEAHVDAGRPMDALSALLPRLDEVINNSWAIMLWSVTLRGVLKTIPIEIEKSEQAFIAALGADMAESISLERIAELKVYLDLCFRNNIDPHPTLRRRLRDLTHKDDAHSAWSIEASFRGEVIDYNSSMHARTSTIVNTPVVLEREGTTISNGIDQSHVFESDRNTFSVIRNARLYMLPDLYGLIELQEGVFHGREGGALNPYVGGIVQRHGDRLLKFPSHIDCHRYPVERLRGRYLVPFRAAAVYYFHFLFEAAQTVFDSRTEHPEIKIIASSSPDFYIRFSKQVGSDILDCVKGQNQTISWLPDGIYDLDEIVVPRNRQLGTLEIGDVIASLRPSIFRSELSKRNVLITRRPDLPRAVLNTDEIIEEFNRRKLDLTVIELEQLSFWQQVDLFATADTVIAPHGGGLSNMMFSRPGNRIIELHHDTTGLMYRDAAFLKDLAYLAYFPERIDMSKNFFINPQKLIETIAITDTMTGFEAQRKFRS